MTCAKLLKIIQF